jgi:DEAD/DEAH box helicase domain-containing protein
MGTEFEGRVLPFPGPRTKPWARRKGLADVLEQWRTHRTLQQGFVLETSLPAVEGQFAELPSDLSPAVTAALTRRGLTRLYAHQAEAIALARSGQDVVIATPTASGKSLCFHVPVLDALSREEEGRALYVFPTKALSRDQEDALRGLMTDAGLAHGAVTYDGDTPGDARRAARERSSVVITNPDMLHAGLLPHHASWARLLSNLRYVVVDELHAYRGVFGSHLANVLRRLERIARFHGSTPRFIFASATIGNPGEHASKMLGRPVAAVTQNGAPAGKRHVRVYNPPVVNAELGMRASYVKSAVRLTVDLVRAEVPTLLFGQSRNTVEVMLKYLRDALQEDRIDPASITAYRGGYLPGTRRSIETALRSGQIRCAVATSALELGIDVGALDAVICAGYPGSMAALWQRFGRAGRREHDSLALLVCSSAPLDQYFAGAPRLLVGAPVEHARIDPDNVEILVQQLKCAAFELPFESGEGFRELPAGNTTEALEFLAQHRVLHAAAGAAGRVSYHWSSEVYPANHVSLRSVGWDNVVVVDLDGDRALAEMDFRSAHTMLHEQAIYQHDAEQFQVEKLDLANRKAFVRKVAPDYFTTALTHARVNVIEEEHLTPLPDSLATAGFGEVSVVEKVVGFKKIKFHTHENVGYGEVALPELQLHTTAFWVTLPETSLAPVAAPRPAVLEALRGIGNALHTVACVGLMMDPHDLSRALGSAGGGALFNPTLFLYDSIPGGVGLASRLFEQRLELLQRARGLLDHCACEDGCPGCIGPRGAAEPVRPEHPRKALCATLLSLLGPDAVH